MTTQGREQRCPEQQRVDAHFEGGLRPSDERAMRLHLPGCEACTARYERHLLLGALDPKAVSADTRIARGLGFDPTRPSVRFARVAAPLAVFAVAASVLLFFGIRRAPSDPRSEDLSASGFTARGGARSVGSQVFVYRAAQHGQPVRAGDTLNANDELAFAYENLSAKRYLVIFGVDEHRHLYWYYPAWSDANASPTSVPVEIAPGTHALPDAVAHALDGKELTIHAIFSDIPIAVKTVEAQVTSGTPVTAPDDSSTIESTLQFMVVPQ